MTVDPTPHLIVAFAACSPSTWLQIKAPLEPKNLGKLVRGMTLIHSSPGEAASLSPPHEKVLAGAWGLTSLPAEGRAEKGSASLAGAVSPYPNRFPETKAGGASQDGLLPWAALEAKAAPQQAWAFITLCHWAMGREHATLTDPAALDITPDESRTLLADMQPYFATEGITLHHQNDQPCRWLAEGAVFKDLPTASLDRAMGRNVDPLLPNSKAIKLLQNEMQMLLYAHPINDARASHRQRTINSFWLSGTGALSESAVANPTVLVNRGLAQAAFTDDAAAFSAGWEQLDATDIAQFLNWQQSGQTVRISLCGEANAVTFETAKPSFFSKIKNTFKLQSIDYLLRQL